MTTATELNLIPIFVNDRRMVPYRPEWRRFAGSVTATILLSQIFYRWDKYGQKGFYKFKEPCTHRLYKTGDSWTEELEFSSREFDTALKTISFKRTKKNAAEKHSLPVEYWITRDRVTYYTIIPENMNRLLNSVYTITPKPALLPEIPDPSVSDNSLTAESADSVNADSAVTKMRKAQLPYKQRRPEKKTTAEKEITPDKSGVDSPSPPLVAAASPEEIEKLIGLIPIAVTTARQAWITAKADHFSLSYLHEKILYTNQQIKDRRKYWAYLGKCIDFDYGAGFLEEAEAEQIESSLKIQQAQQKEARKLAEEQECQKIAEQENALREKARERFRQMSAKEQQDLRSAFLEQAKPFEVNRLSKLPIPESCKNIAFLNYCTNLILMLPPDAEQAAEENRTFL